MNDVAQKVARGIKFLDKNRHRANWREQIDLDNLDLFSTRSCVIGQLAGSPINGSWPDVLLHFRLNEPSAVNMGFTAGRSADPLAFAELTAEWKKQLSLPTPAPPTPTRITIPIDLFDRMIALSEHMRSETDLWTCSWMVDGVQVVLDSN